MNRRRGRTWLDGQSCFTTLLGQPDLLRLMEPRAGRWPTEGLGYSLSLAGQADVLRLVWQTQPRPGRNAGTDVVGWSELLYHVAWAGGTAAAHGAARRAVANGRPGLPTFVGGAGGRAAAGLADTAAPRAKRGDGRGVKGAGLETNCPIRSAGGHYNICGQPGKLIGREA